MSGSANRLLATMLLQALDDLCDIAEGRLPAGAEPHEVAHICNNAAAFLRSDFAALALERLGLGHRRLPC